MKKKLLSIILCVAMFAVMLSGCGSSDTDKKPEANNNGGSGSGDGDGLVYWSMWEETEPQAIAIKESIDKFTKDTGIKVSVEFKGRTGIREGLQPALDAGTNIDVFDEDIDRVNKTWTKYLLDLETYVKDSDYEKTANPILMAACREAAGGSLKSLPYQPNIFAFFCNEDIFKEAGVDKLPTTWDELLAACEKIKAIGKTPITCDDAYITCMFGYHMSRLLGAAKAEEVVKNGEWDNEAVMATAKAYEELASKGYFSPNVEGNVWPAGQNTELALGEAAMYLNGSWLPNEVKGTAGEDFNWGCFSYPAVEGGTDGTEAANFGGQVFAINAKSKKADDAYKLISYLTKGEADALITEKSIGIPADTSNTEWPKIMANAGVKEVMDSLTTRYSWAAGAEANANMTPIIKENFLKLCGGSMTAQEFVDALKNAGK